MKKFTLLINGKDVDTGLYEYFPYADRYISDFKGTFRVMTRLKTGKLIEESTEVDDCIYAKYSIGDDDTNRNAIEAAYGASLKFRLFPVSIRRKILYDIHKYLLKNKEDLINLLIIEGHPRKLAEWEFSGMEKAYRKESLDLFKDELWKEVGHIGQERMYWARKPDGVICLSPPKNASCSNSLTAGFVFLGGNTLIIKPPLKMPIATIFLWKEVVNNALKENNVPDGTLNIVLGNSKQITDEWFSSPHVNDIIYFGDSEAGLELGRRAFECGKKPILELSGNDMLFVWKDCDIEGAMDSSLDAFLGSTQICMVPKTIIIHGDVFDIFVSKFIDKVKAMKVGLPSDDDVYLTPVILIDKFFEFLNDALEKGAKVLCGGQRVDHLGVVHERGLYIQPTLLSIEDDTRAFDMKCVKEENFFPLLPLVKVTSPKSGRLEDEDIFNKMVVFSNSNEFGLRASVWVNSYIYTRKFIKYLDNSGLLRVNSRHVDFSYYLSTHGGIRRTGGPFGEMNYIWQKTTHLQGISLTRNKATQE